MQAFFLFHYFCIRPYVDHGNKIQNALCVYAGGSCAKYQSNRLHTKNTGQGRNNF